MNKRNEKPSNLLHCIEVTSPWHRIGVDLTGPLPHTASGNSYIVTCCDYFTKWPEAMALPDKSAAGEVLKKYMIFKKNLLCRIIYLME